VNRKKKLKANLNFQKGGEGLGSAKRTFFGEGRWGKWIFSGTMLEQHNLNPVVVALEDFAKVRWFHSDILPFNLLRIKYNS